MSKTFFEDAYGSNLVYLCHAGLCSGISSVHNLADSTLLFFQHYSYIFSSHFRSYKFYFSLNNKISYVMP